MMMECKVMNHRMMMEYKMMKRKKANCKKMKMGQEDKLQEDEDGHYPMFQKENDSDLDDNSGAVLSNPNPRSVVCRPATHPGFNSADWNASHELVNKAAAIIAMN
jgi:hypothetical protein